MLEQAVRIIYVIVFAVINFYVMKTLLKSNESLFKFKNFMLVLLEAVIYYALYTVAYDVSLMILKLSLQFLINIFIFNDSFFKIMIAYVISFILLFIADLFNTSIYIHFTTIEELRNNWCYMLLSNTTVMLTTFLIIKIKAITTRLSKFIEDVNIDKDYDKTAFFILMLVVLINLAYNVANIFELNYGYIINVVIIVILFGISYIYVINSLHYSNLLKEYDDLFLYIQEFEDMIDNISIINHEVKNQLVVLNSYIELDKKKEALDIISDITKNAYQTDERVLVELKHLPKGGLKGLIYYKVLMAKNKKVNIEIDISKNVFKNINKLSINENKILCRIIGVYLDNAIEAATNTKNKMISIEIYALNKSDIHIVISNTFNNKNLDINKIGKKGYTTKGKGHGRGTYFASKLISKNDWLTETKKIINNLYVEKVIVDTNKK